MFTRFLQNDGGWKTVVWLNTYPRTISPLGQLTCPVPPPTPPPPPPPEPCAYRCAAGSCINVERPARRAAVSRSYLDSHPASTFVTGVRESTEISSIYCAFGGFVLFFCFFLYFARPFDVFERSIRKTTCTVLPKSRPAVYNGKRNSIKTWFSVRTLYRGACTAPTDDCKLERNGMITRWNRRTSPGPRVSRRPWRCTMFAERLCRDSRIRTNAVRKRLFSACGRARSKPRFGRYLIRSTYLLENKP